MGNRRCTRCKVEKDITAFNKRASGIPYQHCKQCTEKETKTRESTRCPHNKRAYICPYEPCVQNAKGLCQHKNQKAKCVEFPCIENEDVLCSHNSRKTQCKHHECLLQKPID